MVLEKTGKGYTVTSLIKSSGLLADVSLLISSWDETKSADENFDEHAGAGGARAAVHAPGFWNPHGRGQIPGEDIAPARLHILAFAFVAFHLKRSEPSGERLVHHPHWRLFFLGAREVEAYFAEADAQKLVSYQAAGSIIRIEFPTADFLEYAHALVGRTI